MIKIIPVNDNFVPPTKQNSGDACFDVVAISREITPDYIEYGLGFSSEIPPNKKGVIVPRSSISKKNLIMCNSPAQIDSGYKGEWKVRFKPVNKLIYAVSYDFDENGLGFEKAGELNEILSNIYVVGDRIAQIYFEEVKDFDIEGVNELDDERNEGGFGSTGV